MWLIKMFTPCYSIEINCSVLYWTDWNNTDGETAIGRANLDGSGQIHMLRGLGKCGSITVDIVNKTYSRLYWVNYSKRRLETSELNGKKYFRKPAI